jgi:hypothetical protein
MKLRCSEQAHTPKIMTDHRRDDSSSGSCCEFSAQDWFPPTHTGCHNKAQTHQSGLSRAGMSRNSLDRGKSAPQNGVLVPSHLLNECLCTFLPPIHDQREAHRQATDDLSSANKCQCLLDHADTDDLSSANKCQYLLDHADTKKQW